MGWQPGAREREYAKLFQMVRLHLVGHRRREVKVGHEDEVDHRDGGRIPRAVFVCRQALFFAIGFEGDAQLFGNCQALTAYVARLGEGVHEVTREFLLHVLFCEFVAA